MYLIRKIMQMVKEFYQRWIPHLYLARKWNSMPWNLRFVFLAVIYTLLLSIFIAYDSYISSDYYLSQMSPRVNIHNSILSRCCHEPTNHLDMCGRPDCIWPCPIPIDNQQLKSAAGDKAFVLETSGATSLDFRQACSVESLAYRNPNLTVYLLMTGQYVESASMSALTHNYPNIIVKTIDLASYMTGHWKGGIFAQSGIVVGTQWPISVTLSDFSRNFAVAEDGYLVANGIIHADYRHPVIQSALYEFSTEYKYDYD